MSFLTTPAFADTALATAADPAAAGSLFTSMLPVVLIFIIFYVLIIRPQNKRMQEHRAMINNLKKGDKVVTGGGLVATVKKAEGDDIVLEIASGVEVTAVRSTLMSVRGDAAAKKE